MKKWLKKRLKEAILALVERGVPEHLLRCKLKVHPLQFSCRAYVYTGDPTIHVANWWLIWCFMRDDVDAMEHLLRHELAHIIVNRVEAVAEAFSIGEYPPAWKATLLGIMARLSIIKYEDICPEEKFAEQIGRLQWQTVQKLVKIVG